MEIYTMKIKSILLIFLTIAGCQIYGQVKKKYVSIDTLGRTVEYLDLLEMAFSKKYKIIKDESDPAVSLSKPVRTTPREYDSLIGLNSNSKFIYEPMHGKKFPSFNTRDLQGKRYNLSAMRGKVVVINFWFVECIPCRIEMPELNELYKQFAENDQVIFLSFAKSTEEKVNRFLSTRKFDYPIALLTPELLKLFNIEGYPVNAVIDKNGICSFASIGLKTGGVNMLNEAIVKALDEK
jgi:thiol-disulfide isomerase/thioredoxin